MKTNQPAVYVNTVKMADLLERISTGDLKVLLAVMEHMNNDNLITITQKALSNELEMCRSQVTRSYKHLAQEKILIKIPSTASFFMNPIFSYNVN